MEPTPVICSSCDRPIAANAPLGLCPACLLGPPPITTDRRAPILLPRQAARRYTAR